MKINYGILMRIFFYSAIFLRLMLWLFNPPNNAFDNHFEPILLIMKYGTIPAKDACFQCYHPPVYYFISAVIGKIFIHYGANNAQILKILQLVCCVYGILTVGIVNLILKKMQLSDFSMLIAFGTICFLPRHIYMSAMNSNDTISYLFVAICIYLLLITIEQINSLMSIIALTVAITITIFTKYTAFVVIPVFLTVFLKSFLTLPVAIRMKYGIIMIIASLIPLLFLSAYMFSNVKNYGNALPWNLNIKDPSVGQPRDKGGVNFTNFKPWESIKSPILVPGKLNSFWTIVYSGMWFDTEPKFLYFMDPNTAWWGRYYGWLRGEEHFPGDNPSISKTTIMMGSGLITLGLFPLLFFIIGIYYYLRGLQHIIKDYDYKGSIKMAMMFMLLACNVFGVIAITLRLPTYTAMKASYFLNSMPAFAIYLGIGVMACEKVNKLK